MSSVRSIGSRWPIIRRREQQKQLTVRCSFRHRPPARRSWDCFFRIACPARVGPEHPSVSAPTLAGAFQPLEEIPLQTRCRCSNGQLVIQIIVVAGETNPAPVQQRQFAELDCSSRGIAMNRAAKCIWVLLAVAASPSRAADLNAEQVLAWVAAGTPCRPAALAGKSLEN